MSQLSGAWFADKRWFGAKGSISEPGPAITTTIDGALSITIVEVADQFYQLVTTTEQADSLADPQTGQALAAVFANVTAGGTYAANGPAGSVTFMRTPPPIGSDRVLAEVDLKCAPVRLLGVEQSNSSLVIADRLILKVLRRLQSGPHPEIEMLGYLGEQNCPGVPALLGWYEVHGGPIDAVLGVLQEFVADGTDGWRLILDGLAIDRGATIPLLNNLGHTLGEVHGVLGRPTDDPSFAPTDTGRQLSESIAAAVGADCNRLAGQLNGRDDLSALINTAELSEQLSHAADLASQLGERLLTGLGIRHHGDLHLGQTLHSQRGWQLIDWEGEPARSLEVRRAKQPALRDVAGMLRSFDYAAATAGGPAQGWTTAARASFLDGYLSSVDERLLPKGASNQRRTLALLELEKVIYEIDYEAANRPEWLPIPIAGLRNLLEANQP